MGGPGSGNWHFRDRKVTVEESFSISVSDLRRTRSHSGVLSWSANGAGTFSLNWFVSLPIQPCQPTLTLQYQTKSESVRSQFDLCTTPVHFGGHRWWFVCSCGRRVGTLHLPAQYESIRFACRDCHRLAYRSSQQAHREERFIGQLQRWVESKRKRMQAAGFE